MKALLINRGYQEKMVDNAIARASRVPREVALRQGRPKVTSKTPVFVLTYDSRLPSAGSIQAKHCCSMVSRNKYLANVFPAPPLTAYRRQPNLRSHVIRAAVAKGPERYLTRNQWGMKKCKQPDCKSCPCIRRARTLT